MKKALFTFSVLVIVLSSFTIFHSGDNCPICKSPQHRTGATKIEYAKILHEVKCGLGHSFWLPEETNSAVKPGENTNGTCNCPVCGHPGFATSTPAVKKCVNDHEFGCE